MTSDSIRPAGDNNDEQAEAGKQRRLRWPLWTGAGLLGVVLTGAGASLAFANATPQDTIALGTSVSGVDLGGMTVAQATTALEAEDVELSKVRVAWAGERITFNPTQAGIGIDPAASAQAAYEATADSGVFTRTVNMYLGHEVDPQLEQDLTGLTSFVEALPGQLSEAPTNATLSGVPGEKLRVTPSSNQTGLDRERLTRDLTQALTAEDDKPTVKGHKTIVAQAEVTTRELKSAANDSAFLYVNQRAEGPLQHQSVSLYRNGKFVRSYPVSTGQAAWPTNVGLRQIESHVECPPWVQGTSSWFPNPGTTVPGCSPGNPLGPLWLGIGDGEGFHVGSVYVLSHGCIHMNEPDIRALYDELPNGTPVYVGPL